MAIFFTSLSSVISSEQTLGDKIRTSGSLFVTSFFHLNFYYWQSVLLLLWERNAEQTGEDETLRTVITVLYEAFNFFIHFLIWLKQL